jgi:glycosyltransferase involved in cell wall biosynthesis
MRAVVPAYNEAATVASVVDVLSSSRAFDEVVVVDDGSSDDTSKLAAAAGASVVRTPGNRGKGGAMLYAIQERCPNDDAIAFFDADLLGLRADHVRRLVHGAELGYDMVCGLRDKGSVQNVLQLGFSPVITGERIVRRWVLDALPLSCWSGFSIETAMNDAVARHGGRTALVFLDGVTMRTKSQKSGLARGVRDHLRMASQIVRTRRALQSTRGGTCRL